MTAKRIFPALLAAFSLLALTTLLVAGQPIPGRWDKMEKLDEGVEIEIELRSGEIFQGSFTALRQDSVNLLVADEARKFPRQAVLRIISLESRRDSSANGIALGGAGGAAAGAGIGVAVFGDASDDRAGAIALSALTGAAIGAVVGGVIDSAIPKTRQDEILYLGS